MVASNRSGHRERWGLSLFWVVNSKFGIAMGSKYHADVIARAGAYLSKLVMTVGVQQREVTTRRQKQTMSHASAYKHGI